MSWRIAAPRALLAGVLALALSCATSDGATPKEELAQWLDGSQNAYDKLNDYTCIFVQRELVNDELLPEERVQMKFKKPFLVYIRRVVARFTPQEPGPALPTYVPRRWREGGVRIEA